MTHRGPFQPLLFCDSVICQQALGLEIRLEAAFVHRCKPNLPASSAGGVVAGQAQVQSRSLTVHRADKGSEEGQ